MALKSDGVDARDQRTGLVRLEAWSASGDHEGATEISSFVDLVRRVISERFNLASAQVTDEGEEVGNLPFVHRANESGPLHLYKCSDGPVIWREGEGLLLNGRRNGG